MRAREVRVAERASSSHAAAPEPPQRSQAGAAAGSRCSLQLNAAPRRRREQGNHSPQRRCRETARTSLPAKSTQSVQK